MEISNYSDRPIGETGVVNSINHNRKTIFFENEYENPVIFTQPLSFNGPQAAIVRIDEIKSDRFTAFVQEPDYLDGSHKNESFSFLVLEKGTWQLEDSTVIDVGTTKTNLLGNEGWENVSFAGNFDNDPLVFSQVQTNNDSDFVVTRQRNTSAKGFQITMQEEEALMDSGHGIETVGWFAISEGSGVTSENQYQAASTGNSVKHDWQTIKFDSGFDQSPVFISSIATYNGADTSQLRSDDLTNSQIKIKIEEESSADEEIFHAKENVNYFVIEPNSILRGYDINSPIVIDTDNNSVNQDSSTDNSVNQDSLVNDTFYYSSSNKETISIESDDLPRRWSIGSYHSPVWTTNKFDGSFSRQITEDGKHLQVELDINSGGFDTGMYRLNKSTRIDELDSQVKVSSKIDIDLSGSGQWWVGPKLWIQVSDQEKYENYVIENSSTSVAKYHKMFTNEDVTPTGRYLGETKHDGSVYKHYYKKHNDNMQFYAIRQNYRTDSTVSLKPILNMWRNKGLPNAYVNTAKINLETSGEVSGTVDISNINITKW